MRVHVARRERCKVEGTNNATHFCLVCSSTSIAPKAFGVRIEVVRFSLIRDPRPLAHKANEECVPYMNVAIEHLQWKERVAGRSEGVGCPPQTTFDVGDAATFSITVAVVDIRNALHGDVEEPSIDTRTVTETARLVV